MKTTIIRRIDPCLWRKFKSLCARKGITINQKILELIKKYVDENWK